MKLNPDETLEDLLINDYKIIQSKRLYRFSSDAVLLSRFATVKRNETVADLCAGSGIVGLHFYALHPEEITSVAEFELQSELADDCKRSVEYNGLTDKITTYNMPVQNIPSDFNGSFSLLLCNPPYKKTGSGEINPNESEALARHEIALTLEELSLVAKRLLKHGGRFCLCQRIERFTDVFCEFRKNGIEPSRLQFVRNKNGKEPYLFLVEGVKGVKRKFSVLPEIVN